MTLYYVSSKLKHRDKWANTNLEILSSWVTNPELREGEELTEMWNAYRTELGWADIFAMYLEPNETPKGALLELGIAFRFGLPIYIVWQGTIEDLEAILGTVVHHESVTVVKTISELPQ